MQKLSFAIATVVASFALGCGSSDSGTPGTTGTNVGTSTKAGIGTKTSTSTSTGTGDSGQKGLTINASDGIKLVMEPLTGEGAVKGLVDVMLDSESVARGTAAVTINGVSIPENQVFDGFFDPDKATIPNAAPGSSLVLNATSGAKTATVSLPCPANVTITSPAEGSTVAAGSPITVTWNGQTEYNGDLMGLFSPVVTVVGYDPGTNMASKTFALGSSRASVTSGASSAQVTTPTDGSAGYLVELSIPGTFTETSLSKGVCYLIRRVHLISQ